MRGHNERESSVPRKRRAKSRMQRWARLVIGLTASAWFSCAHADCFDVAGQRYNLNADLLRSIAYYESHMNPAAVHRNANGTVDLGLMQINSIHLPELAQAGIEPSALRNACVNASAGAALLREQIDQSGSTWVAVGQYHSHTGELRDTYARTIHDIYVRRAWEPHSGDGKMFPEPEGVSVAQVSVR